MKKIFLSISLVSLLSGCSSTPAPERSVAQENLGTEVGNPIDKKATVIENVTILPPRVAEIEEKLDIYFKKVSKETEDLSGKELFDAQIKAPGGLEAFSMSRERDAIIRTSPKVDISSNKVCILSVEKNVTLTSLSCSFNFYFKNIKNPEEAIFAHYNAGRTYDENDNPVESQWKDTARLATFGLYAIGESLFGDKYYRKHCAKIKEVMLNKFPQCQ